MTTFALEPGQAVLIAPDGTMIPVPPEVLADIPAPSQAVVLIAPDGTLVPVPPEVLADIQEPEPAGDA